MPNLFLDPIGEPDPQGEKDEAGNVKKIYTDPVADIVEYLLDPSHVAGAAEPALERPADKNDEAPTNRSPRRPNRMLSPTSTSLGTRLRKRATGRSGGI